MREIAFLYWIMKYTVKRVHLVVVYAINNMLANLLSSINTNVTEFLDRLIFINSDVTLNLINVLGKNSYSGINLICNSLIYGFLLYYAFSYLLSHLTFAQIESPHQFIFKLILCVFALNASLVLCSGLIFIFSYVSNMFRCLCHRDR